MAEKSCVICGGEESAGEVLVEAPCRTHWVCTDDVASFFERGTQNESLFPPKCCGQIFLLQDYEDYVPFEVSWPYQVKEHGEYATLAKFRVYCANPPCGKFLHPSAHITDPETKVTYAICEDDACGKLTCAGCKVQLDQGTQNHTCKRNDEEEKFKETAIKNGYQECSVCGATVELAEACNHITCECGHGFCYVCGKNWEGLHGCPHYGQPKYDEEGYNQDGYHRETGLNREGLNRRQETARRRGANPDEEDEFDEEEDDPDWEVLQHLDPNQRIMINNLVPDAREDALDQLRIELFETRGIHFNTDPPPRLGAPPHIEPQIMPHIQAIVVQLAHEAATNQGPVADTRYDEITRERAQQITPGTALWMLQQIDRGFDPQTDQQLRPEQLQDFAQGLQAAVPHPHMPDIQRLFAELVAHLVVRANQLANEQADEQVDEQDENQAPAPDDAETEVDASTTASDSDDSPDKDNDDDDGDFMIDEEGPGERFADDQSEPDNSDLNDEPEPATPAEEPKPHLWGPPGG